MPLEDNTKTIDLVRQISLEIKAKSEHDLAHHHNVVYDALRLSNSHGNEVNRDLVALASLVYGSGHEHKANPEAIAIIEEISTHRPKLSHEASIVKAAVLVNSTSLPKFKQTHDFVVSKENGNIRDYYINEFTRKHLDEWLENLRSVPQNSIFTLLPTATKIYEERLNETLKFMRQGSDGHETYKEWIEAYDSRATPLPGHEVLTPPASSV